MPVTGLVSDIITLINMLRIQRLKYVERMKKNEIPKQVMKNKPEEKIRGYGWIDLHIRIKGCD